MSDQANSAKTPEVTSAAPLQPSSEKGGRLVAYGAELVGGTVGGTIGVLFGPPGAVIGAGLGAVATRIVADVIGDVAQRTLSWFEERRVAKAAYRIATSVTERVDRGGQPREDEAFIRKDEQGRNAAAEILEGVLLKCQREYDEKKTRFIENIFTNIAFRPDISPDAAYSLLNIVDRLTYRQLCLLALIRRPQRSNIDPNSLRFQLQSTSHQNSHTPFLRQELADLDRYGFFDEMRGDATAYLSTLGTIACELMGLDEVPAEDIRRIRSYLP